LLFERFLNPERISMPDFDVEFCKDRRDEVIRYVQEKYGADRAAQIITFRKLQARAVLRDVGRVLEMPYGQVDRICKLVPNNPANPIPLGKAIEGEPQLQAMRDGDEAVRRLMEIALKLEGLYRNASTHAAGVVIGDRPLDELVPLYRDPRSSMPATQFNLKYVELAGLVKFDFLGLKTLTVLQRAGELLKARGVELDLAHMPLGDAKTYEMLGHGDTVGVFQLEGQGMRDTLRKLRPNRFEDIIALVALYRPGPMDDIPKYINVKQGNEGRDYLHPMLKDILEETYGIIVYQEQVLQIAQTLSGFSLGKADLLRRAMGKKIKSEMDAQRAAFIEGAAARGVPEAQATMIFEKVEKFAGYGFNKCHSAPYALVAYQTAYLKANHPVEFLAASMTLDLGNTDKLNTFRQECERVGIKLLPPDINRSDAEFAVEDTAEGPAIRYALAAIKGVGAQAVEAIVKARGQPPFADLADFAARIDGRALNKRTLECLAAAGAFDCLEPNRARAFAAVDAMLAYAQRQGADAASGQAQLFGAGPVRATIHMPEATPWLPAERLQREYDAIGFFLSGHPLDDYQAALARLRVQQWSDFARAVRAGASAGRLAATVVSRTERRIKSGSKMGIIGLSDPTGHFEAVIFAEGLAQFRDLLEPGNAVLLQVGAELQGEEVRVRIHGVESLDEAASKTQRGLRVFVRSSDPIDLVKKRLAPNGGKAEKLGEVSFVLGLADGSEVEVKLPGRYPISPQIAGAMKAVPGVVAVQEM
jgi:DNA polymerase-3 subunit alpha